MHQASKTDSLMLVLSLNVCRIFKSIRSVIFSAYLVLCTLIDSYLSALIECLTWEVLAVLILIQFVFLSYLKRPCVEILIYGFLSFKLLRVKPSILVIKRLRRVSWSSTL